jgi:hypothetical protein
VAVEAATARTRHGVPTHGRGLEATGAGSDRDEGPCWITLWCAGIVIAAPTASGATSDCGGAADGGEDEDGDKKI